MDVTDGQENPPLLKREQVATWLEVTAGARINEAILERLMPPREGSFLRPTSEDPLRKMGWWCHGYLQAAADHLMLWADYFAPLRARHDELLYLTLRPVFTLARASIESSAQTIWALGPDDPADCGRRFFQLVLWDVDEQAKAAAGTEKHTELLKYRDELLSFFGLTAKKFRPPNYLDIVRYVARFLGTGDPDWSMTPGRVERIWRSTAGAAHGKQWPGIEFEDRLDAGDGLFWSTPQIAAISEVLEVADTYLSAGVILFAQRAGYANDLDAFRAEAAERLKRQIVK